MGAADVNHLSGVLPERGTEIEWKPRDACENKNECVCVWVKVDDVTTWFCKLVGMTW